MSTPKVFISYSHKDEDWVRNWLLPKLEGNGLQAHIDYRDFEIGVPSVINMERAVEQCAKTALVLTPHWCESEWTQFEGIMLQTQDPVGLKKKILPLMLCDCALPNRLKIFTYADFRNTTDWDFQIERVINQIQKDFEELEPPKFTYPPLSTENIDIQRLPKTGYELFGRQKELQLLDEAWESGAFNVLSFVAYGGVGKSTLVNKWVEKLRWDNYRGAEKVFAWSFYSQGTNELVISADMFINEALKWFGDKDPKLGSPWDRGKRLADLIRRHRTLLLLDGLEPLQSTYDSEYGKIKDPALSTLVSELAKRNNGLCVITTREKVHEVERLTANCQQLSLEQISDEAGRALLRVRRVQGTDDELQRLSREFGNYALAITLLAEYIRLFPGHLAKLGFDIPNLDIPEKEGRHARRVMEALAKHFGEGLELELLLMLGLFSRPAPKEALDAVMKEPIIPGLTDHLARCSEAEWLRLLQKLRDFRLIARESKHRPDVIDCHPLIREHFGEKLKANNPKAWQEANSRLYDYYKSLPEKLYGKYLPDTLEEMEPLFAAVAHGCQAGRFNEALLDIYWKRISRKDDRYSPKKLGAFGSDLSALSNFFEIPWIQPSLKLEEQYRFDVLSLAGVYLRALGRLKEAAEPIKESLKFEASQNSWKSAAIRAGNLSELYLTLGDVLNAVEYARQSVDFADRSGDGFEKESDRATLADALHKAGKLAAVEQLFEEAETMQQQRQPEYCYLYSLRGFQFCDLLLSQGKVREVLERAGQTLEYGKAGYGYSLLDFALNKLSSGRAYLLQAQADGKNDYKKAQDYLNAAVAGLREAGHQEFVARGLLARAFFYRVQNNFPHAWEDLAEAQEIAERGGMGLWLADYHLEAGRLIYQQLAVERGQSAVGNYQVLLKDKQITLSRKEMLSEFESHLQTAKEMVDKMGYGRRQPEILLLEAQLAFAKDEKVEARVHLGKAKQLLEKMGIREWDFEVRELERQLR